MPPPPDEASTPGDGIDLDRFARHSLHTSLFFPQSRLFVAGNPKAAGTSLRWWLLEAHGVDVAAATAGSLWGESAPHQAVWDGSLGLPYTWDALSEAEQVDALRAGDVLSVLPVRHPVTRAFSAWSGKYLTGEPYYEERLPEGLPRLPERITSADDVGSHFEALAEALERHVHQHPDWQDVDVHFWPQHRLLARRPAGPALLLRQESLAQGLEQVSGHLRAHGVDPAPPRRMNETVVGYRPDLVTERALAALGRLYADDLRTWGYRAEAPASHAPPPDLDWLNDVRGRNRRYGVVHRAALAARQREQELLASRSWRVTRPLRWATDRLRGR